MINEACLSYHIERIKNSGNIWKELHLQSSF
nr:MAG TPA: hypothetical protein [Caudoviricetes sp.]